MPAIKRSFFLIHGLCKYSQSSWKCKGTIIKWGWVWRIRWRKAPNQNLCQTTAIHTLAVSCDRWALLRPSLRTTHTRVLPPRRFSQLRIWVTVPCTPPCIYLRSWVNWSDGTNEKKIKIAEISMISTKERGNVVFFISVFSKRRSELTVMSIYVFAVEGVKSS